MYIVSLKQTRPLLVLPLLPPLKGKHLPTSHAENVGKNAVDPGIWRLEALENLRKRI